MLFDYIHAYIKRRRKLKQVSVTTGAEYRPTLPNELWIHILEIASRPTIIIGDDNCSPDEIERCLIMRAESRTAPAAGHLFQKNKRRLGAVCHLWRQLMDAIIWQDWVWDVSNRDGSIKDLEKRKSKETQKLIPRINIHFEGVVPIKLNNNIQISSLTFVTATSTINSLDIILSMVPYPSSLQSLHLTLPDIQNLDPSLLLPLADSATPLHTLSLRISNYSLFHLPLEFPYLTTLSLHLVASHRPTTDPSPTKWNLPSLTNLSLEFPLKIQDEPTCKFISYLLVEKLRALRLIWPHNAGIIDTSSPEFWRKVPMIEVLATEFAALFSDHSGKTVAPDGLDGLLRMALPNGLSARHLIQNGYSSPSEFIPGLLKVMERCPTLDTISLSPAVSNRPFSSLDDKRAAISDLERVCRSRGIKILNVEGLERKEARENRLKS